MKQRERERCMKMQSDSIIRAQHEHIVLGKRARSGTVSPSSHLVSEREPNFRSGRNVQPRLSQPDRSRNQRSRKSYDSTASNTSETSSAASESKGSKIALGATENAAASFSASSNTTPADEPAPDDSDEDTSSISSSSSSSSSSSGGDVSGNDSSNDYGNGVIASDSEDSSSTSRSDVIIHLSSTSKPNMDREQVLKEGEGLQYRLENFLPQMAAANSALHTSLKDGREDDYDIENIDDSKGNYIEMVCFPVRTTRHLVLVRVLIQL